MENKFIKSNYVVDVPVECGARRYMSTLLLSIVELDVYHVELVEHCHEKTDLSDPDVETLHQLCDLGIVRLQSNDDFSLAWRRIEEWRSYKFLSVAFCLTFDCNFRCVYCYERPNLRDRKFTQAMSSEMAISILAWMNNVMQMRDIDSSRITFFGGEPLLRYPVIKEVLKHINSLTQAQSPELYMSTNGYLLSTDKVETMKASGLQRLQVTLDGPAEVHDRRRPLVSGQGTFAIIVNNLVECLRKGIGVDLLTVCDNENISDLLPLVDIMLRHLPEAELRNNIQWSFTLVEPTENCVNRSANLLFGKERNLAQDIHKAREYALDAGFNVIFPYSSNICARQLDYTFGIGPQGDIYPCFGIYGNNDYSIGNISDPFDTVENKSKQWARRDCFDDACISCQVFPLCRGARCQHMIAQINGGAFAQKYCEQEMLLEDIKRSLTSKLASNLCGK